MEIYFVFVEIDKIDYVVKLEAKSAINAEHKILDLGICNSYGCTITGATAFHKKEIKNDYFINCLSISEFISINELSNIISDKNEKLTKIAYVHNEIQNIEKEIIRLNNELINFKNYLKENEE